MPNPSQKPRRLLRFMLTFIAILFIAGIALTLWLVRPLSFDDIVANPNPATSYEEAIARFETLHAHEAKLPLHAEGASILLTHGHPTDRIFVLLHGYTNSPRQFRELGQLLFNEGANVIIPRLPYHGFADRLTDEQGKMTAINLVQDASAGIDIARGLGKRVTVVGLSASGVSAAWLAHHRNDIDETFLLAPFFGPTVVPDRLTPAVTSALLRLPNKFMWWDPRHKENIPGPPLNYPRFGTHPLAETMRLGMASENTASPLLTKRLTLLLTASDIAINNNRARRIVESWKQNSPNTEFAYHTFPRSDRLPHDFIDPLQNGERIDFVYPILVSMFFGKDPASESRTP